MVSDEILRLHDELEIKATSRPWSSHIRKRPGYGPLIFWSRRPELEVMFENAHDARYLSFVRNVAPEFVREIRELRATIKDLQEKIEALENGTKQA